MDENTEVLDTQPEAQEEETPEVEALSPEEIAELRKRADVSSQNYERAKKAEAEKKELQRQLEEAQLNSDSFTTDDDTAREVKALKEKFAQLEEKALLDSVVQKYPAIADKRAEFDEYRMEYPTSKLEVVAKLFLAERDISEETPKRKGLEKAGGGKRTPPTQGHTVDDITRLRTENYREYVKQLRQGKIKV
jgi:hypothetical protein